MTSFTRNGLMAAAVLVAAGGASAQVMTAEIPFSFRAGGASMAPGTYRVAAGQAGMGSASLIRMSNLDTKQAALVVVSYTRDASKAWIKEGVPKLAFECVGAQCSLATIWSGAGPSAMAVAQPARGKGEVASVKEIILRAAVKTE